METKDKLRPLKDELERLYFYLDDKYRLQLPKLVINTQSKGRKKYVEGWFSGKCWEENKTRFCEINICGEYFNNPYECCHTFIHEVAHLVCFIRDIKDTCRSGIYHTKEFKKVAEELGLEVKERDVIRGFAYTSLSKELIKELKLKFQLHENLFNISRITNERKGRTLIPLTEGFYILTNRYDEFINNPKPYLKILNQFALNKSNNGNQN